MLPSIPIADFIGPKPGSRPWNAVHRAIELEPAVHEIGRFLTRKGREEVYYRVKCKGRDRHCVVRWADKVSEEPVASCDCEAFRIPQVPTHCLHIAAIVIHEAKAI